MINRLARIIILIGVVTTSGAGCSSKATEENKIIAAKKQTNVLENTSAKKGINNKIAPRIASLIKQAKASQPVTSNGLIKTKESQVHVYITVKNTEEPNVTDLKNLGIEIEIINKKLKKIQAWVPFDSLNQTAELDNVLAITTPSYGSPRIR